MAGVTQFPVALDSFPAIGPNTDEAAAGVEHDVVHENVHAAVAALQAKVGIDASANSSSIDARVAAVESGKLDASALGAPGGAAQLTAGGMVVTTQLPSYVDDVLEFANFAAFPAAGEAGKIYIAVDPGSQYRWSGSAYAQLIASPGTTDALTEGATNRYFTEERAQDALAAAFAAGTHINFTVTYDDVLGTFTFVASGDGGGAAGPSDMRDFWLMG